MDPIVNWCKDELVFVKTCKFHTVFKVVFIVEVIYILNIIPFALSVINGLYYFLVSFNLKGLFETVSGIILFVFDLINALSLPGFILLILVIWFLVMKSIAYSKLNRMESYNRVVINELGILTGVFGPPGVGKTQLITDMAISSESMLREQALSIMNEIHLLFPNFPFVELEKMIDKKKFHNKIQVKIFLEEFFSSKKCKNKVFNYELTEENSFVYDGLKIHSLKVELLDYAQAYYLYKSALLISSYSIRLDHNEQSLGHFSIYRDNYFDNNVAELIDPKYSKVNDYDSFRFEKKFIENNPYSQLLDGCVCAISEISKERGNMLENKELKKLDIFPNQKNDGFNDCLKLIRHLTTIRHRCFFKGFWDDQRLGSLGTDINSLCESNVYLEDSEKSYKTAFPLFNIIPMFASWIVDKYTNFNLHFRFFREDNTVFTYLLRKFVRKINEKLQLYTNTFCYRVQPLKLSHSSIDGSINDALSKKYYLMNKKIFASRYATACYEAFTLEQKLAATVGINERQSFEDLTANLDELKSQHSYFVNRLLNINQGSEANSASGNKEVSSVPEDDEALFFGGKENE